MAPHRRSTMTASLSLAALAFVMGPRDVRGATNVFNQSASYAIEVNLDDWSNFDADYGGCVTCPYTCIASTTSASLENATLPSIYSQEVMNGCCYAADATTQPDCSQEASPSADLEACGYLYGPTLDWRIDDATDVPLANVAAILFASIDCENFWAIGEAPVRYTSETKSVSGSEQINGGCYGEASGAAMVLAGCLTSKLTFDKSKTYTWDMLANKCEGLSGKCAMTNGIWGEQLECCTSRTTLTSEWDLTYETYTEEAEAGVTLSGPAIVGIVFGGVALMLCLVHYGAKARERARQTAFMREQEATDDYEAVMTPLVGAAGEKKPMAANQRPMGVDNLEVSLHEGDKIFRKPDDELLYEGDMY